MTTVKLDSHYKMSQLMFDTWIDNEVRLAIIIEEAVAASYSSAYIKHSGENVIMKDWFDKVYGRNQ